MRGDLLGLRTSKASQFYRRHPRQSRRRVQPDRSSLLSRCSRLPPPSRTLALHHISRCRCAAWDRPAPPPRPHVPSSKSTLLIPTPLPPSPPLPLRVPP